MFKKLMVVLVALFCFTGVSYAKDVPVQFTWQTGGEADLATWTIVETDDSGQPTGVTFNGTLTGGQVDVATDEVLTYPDNAETTLCWKVRVADTSGNDSVWSEETCRREDDISPGGCINFNQTDR